MSKHTTTLMEIIQGELLRKGFDEFINDGNLTYNDKSFAFIQKVLHFDDDVKAIVDNIIFKTFKFNDERTDRYFKEAFITRFLDREINRQTVESFASQVLYQCIIRENYIYTVFGNDLYKYLDNHVDITSDNSENETYEDNTNNTGSNTTDDRELYSSLPQSEINLNVDNDVLLYGDDNTISKNKNTSNDESKTDGQRDTKGNENSLQKTYTLENLDKLYTMRERIFNDLDRTCFLHIW